VSVIASACIAFGAYQCFDFGELSAHFHLLYLVPKWFELWVTRAYGSQFAGLFAIVAAVVVLDDAARPAAPDRPRRMDRRRMLLLAAAAPLAYVPASALLVAGALVPWRLRFGQETTSFLVLFREALRWDDPFWGFGRTVVYAAILAGLLFAGRRLWLSTKRSLRQKLWVAAGAVVVTYLAEWGIGLASR
jgi:hypothetical protein